MLKTRAAACGGLTAESPLPVRPATGLATAAAAAAADCTTGVDDGGSAGRSIGGENPPTPPRVARCCCSANRRTMDVGKARPVSGGSASCAPDGSNAPLPVVEAALAGAAPAAPDADILSPPTGSAGTGPPPSSMPCNAPPAPASAAEITPAPPELCPRAVEPPPDERRRRAAARSATPPRVRPSSPTTPGSLWWKAAMALKRCVTMRAPHVTAASAVRMPAELRRRGAGACGEIT